MKVLTLKPTTRIQNSGIRDSGFGISAANPSPASLTFTLNELRRKGFHRLYVNGRTVTLDDIAPAELRDQSTPEGHHRSREARRRHARAAHRFDRDGVPRGGRHGIRHRRLARATEVHAHLQRAVRVPELQPHLRSAAAAGCFRSTTRSAPARRAMGSATSSSSISISSCPIRPSRSSRAPSSRGRRRTTARSSPSSSGPRSRPACRWTSRGRDLNDEEKRFIIEGDGKGLRRHSRVLPLARAEEIQGARPRVPQPVSRLSDVSRLRRRASAAARRATSRSAAARSIRCRPIRSARRSSFSRRCSSPRKKRRSATRC